MDLAILEDYAVGVDELGIIRFIESNKDVKAWISDDIQMDWKDLPGWEASVKQWVVHSTEKAHTDDHHVKFWFPGFIDTHIHASQTPNAGIFGKSTLLDWLETYTFPLESTFSSLSVAKRIYNRCIRRTLAAGTTTAAYYATTHVPATNLLATQCLAIGQRAFIGRCMMDSDLHPDYYRDANSAEAFSATLETIEHIKKIDPTYDLIIPILTPRFAPSCTRPLLQEIGKLAKGEDLPIQTHISENPSEVALVKETFPEHPSYAAVYDAYGCLTDRTVLAHACHLTPDEISLVKQRKSKISHCPISNSYLGSGICPVREYLEEGIDVGLGTDVSGGFSHSILVAAREASGVSRLRAAAAPGMADADAKTKMKLSVEECLYLATRGGAKCLGLEKKVGGFEVGMEFDAQTIDLGAAVGDDGEDGGMGGVDLWGKEGWDNRIAKWVFTGDERNTVGVWVKGRHVYGTDPE
ncbi:hypothetical protein MMC25_000486 [Agyrium rufum]|nr:hypothetical protein [Agyrium rufum]